MSWAKSDIRHLFIGDAKLFLIVIFIERASNPEPRLRRRTPDEAYDGLDALERATAPVLRDVAEHSVLDLVPFARAGWVVRDGEQQPRLVGEALKLTLPQACSVTVASASVRRDKQLSCLRVCTTPHPSPPSADRFDGELGGIVVDADVHPAFVARDIVDAVGDRFSEFLVDEVVHAHGHGFAGRLPLRAAVRKSPMSSFFFVSTDTTGSPAR